VVEIRENVNLQEAEAEKTLKRFDNNNKPE
jgi:hypothetical protein